MIDPPGRRVVAISDLATRGVGPGDDLADVPNGAPGEAHNRLRKPRRATALPDVHCVRIHTEDIADLLRSGEETTLVHRVTVGPKTKTPVVASARRHQHPTEIRIAGNCTDAPVLRYTNNGTPVASVAVAVNSRIKNPAGEFVDGPTVFYPVTAWGPQGVNLAESAQKGTRIEVSGRVVENTFTATRGERMGQEVRRWEVVADHVSISLANQR